MFSDTELKKIAKYFKKGSRVDIHKNPNDINHLFGLVNTTKMLLKKLPQKLLYEPGNHLTATLLTTRPLGQDSDRELYLQFVNQLEEKIMRDKSYSYMIFSLINQALMELWGFIQKLENVLLSNALREKVNLKHIMVHH